MNAINPMGKPNMNNKMPISEMVRGAPSAPIVSRQNKSVPTKRAMPVDMDKQMPQMKALIKRMHQQMNRFVAATDPKKRHKLMQVHVKTLQETMKRMHGMRVTQR